MRGFPLVLACFSSVAASQTQVHTVDPDGGADFTEIFEAVTAASAGDIVLLYDGNYFSTGQSFSLLEDKSVAVVADTAAAPVRLGGMIIEGLGAGSHVLVQGMNPVTMGGQLDTIENCAGPVWMERCDFEHLVGGVGSTGGVVAMGCSSAVFTHSTLRTPVNALSGDSHALLVWGARVHLHASSVQGMDEIIAAVLATQGSFLEVFGSSILGGVGAPGSNFHCNGFDGGTALALTVGSHGVSRGANIVGGAGGAPLVGACDPGEDGRDQIVVGGSTLTALSGDARGYEVSSPVRDDELVQATFQGQPGDPVWLVFATRPQNGTATPLRDGELLIGTPRQMIFVGTIPASGTLAIQTAPPTLPAGTEGAVFFSQARFRDLAAGRFVISAPSALVLLDDAF